PYGSGHTTTTITLISRTRERYAHTADSSDSRAKEISTRAPQALSRAATSAGPASDRIRQTRPPAALIALTAMAALAASWTNTPAVSPSARPRRASPPAAARTVRANRGHAVTEPSVASMRAAR